MKDDEIKKILSAMKLEEPSHQQINQWQTAIQKKKSVSVFDLIQKMWWQWLAAGAVGFTCAALIIHRPASPENSANKKEIFMDDATYEYAYSK